MSPSITIVIATHDQAPELRRNLPALLSQQYEPGYAVVVVDESSTDDTDDVLKQLKNDYPQLYTTYIPASSHYVSRRKLALTVGMKAAKSEWVIITEADCQPESDTWLQTMAEAMTDDVDAICGYTQYAPDTKARYAFLRATNWRRNLRHPYRYDGANLAIRRKVFMQRNGFLKNLQYLRSEYDFLVNETDANRIHMVTSPESRMIQEAPTSKSWSNRQLYYMQTRSRLSRSFVPRLLFILSQVLIHLCYLVGAAALVGGILLNRPILMGVSAGFLLLLLVLRTFICHRRIKACGDHIALWKLPLLDVGLPWHYVYYRLRYALASKYDFTRK